MGLQYYLHNVALLKGLTLDLGCRDYDSVRPLKDGIVRAEGWSLTSSPSTGCRKCTLAHGRAQ
jgi:hypothetical protein